MKRNTKITIAALCTMLVMAIAVSVLSFSYASREDGKATLTDAHEVVFADGSLADTYTNIDNIIANSHASGTDADPVYHIVEISSSGVSCGLDKYVLDPDSRTKRFEELVLNAYSTKKDAEGKLMQMAEGKVEYKLFAPSDFVDNTENLAAISKADLIYISNDAKGEFSFTNDIDENLKDVLKSYVVGSFKPLIIDAPKATTGKNDKNDEYLITTLVDQYFAPMGAYRYTFAWDKGTQTVEQFFGHANGSMYLGINGTNFEKNWSIISDKEDSTEEGAKNYKVSKVLSVSSNATSSHDNAFALLGGATKIDFTTNKFYDNKGEEVSADNIYDITGTTFQSKGYNNRYHIPDYVQLDTMLLSEIDSSVDFDQYDMIIFDDSCKGCKITEDCYIKFVDAFYANKSIVYPANFKGAAASDDMSGTTDIEVCNYVELYQLLVTAKGETKYDNVLNTTRSKMSEIFSSKDKGTAKVIVDLINASTFRGIGGSSTGSSSSMFTVLEIQPCYPIDRELALEIGKTYPKKEKKVKTKDGDDQGNYYIYPRDVINGKTKEQILEGSEYYQWELSKAKIADAFGLDVKQVNLLQMSSSELASSKREIYGNVDLVYVGGNNSALTNAYERKNYEVLYHGEFNSDSTFYRSLSGDLDRLASVPIYDMYTHSGDMVNLEIGNGFPLYDSTGKDYSSPTSTAALGVVEGKDIGKPTEGNLKTVALLNGNDISYRNYEDLAKYVKNGLPVVISKDVSAAYKIYQEKDNKQNALDPQSNMVKFLNACKDKLNVMWDFEQDKVVYRDNDGGRLGDTLTGYVSVFAPSTGAISDNDDTKTVVTGNIDNLVALCANKNVTKSRPKLSVTSMPATYNLYDETTKLSNRNLTFKYRVSGTTNYSVKLYIDDDGNSKFDRSTENVAIGNKDTLTYKVADSFNGPLYWMIEVVDNATGLNAYTTGIAFIKSNTIEKQLVRILQIMPGDGKTIMSSGSYGGTLLQGEGGTGQNTLYFCKYCQKSLRKLVYNPVSHDLGNPRNHFETFYDAKYYDDRDTDGVCSRNVYLGLHEHTFGIVPYDSSLPFSFNGGGYGADNWEENLANEVSDLYDFDIDILYRGQFEEYANEIDEAYDVSKMTEAEKKAKIDKYKFDESSDEYAEFSTLTEVDDKVKFILKDEYKQLADQYWQWYQLMKTEKLEDKDKFVYEEKTIDITAKQAEDLFIKRLNAIVDANPNCKADHIEKDGTRQRISLRQEVNAILHDGCYSDLFSVNIMENSGGSTSIQDVHGLVKDSDTGEAKDMSIKDIYEDYIVHNDVKVKLHEEYKKYARYAAGHDWLSDCYDIVLIGASENFAGDDIKDAVALADLKSYVNNDGSLLFFHDTMSPYKNQLASVLTSTLIEDFGMDRYHMSVDSSIGEQGNYVKYVSKDDNKYFMTNLSPRSIDDPDRYSEFANDISKIADPSYNPIYYQRKYDYYLSRYAYTDFALIAGKDSNGHGNPYRYSTFKWSVASNRNQQDAKFNQKSATEYGTNAASQNNVGIVTMYPFTLSSELSISPTHSQSFVCDVEDDDLTVWYSFAGGYNGYTTNSDSNSSIYAADPRDGMNNYFIYSYGNITYCGAGHAKVTGCAKENNDERKLYINIICNSVRKSVKQPTISIYDFGKDTCGDKIKINEEGMYYTKVESEEDYTDFNFRAACDNGATLKSIRIYYDLDYSEKNTTSAYSKDENHKLIADWNSKDNPDKVESNLNVPVFRYDKDLFTRYDKDGKEIPAEYVSGTETIKTHETMLQLQQEYFDKYDGYHTYIVIEATDSKGNKVYQRLKIMLKETLFNLT